MANTPQPIIKKIKKGGHGHHGGAWKVAYADFVTAMMAFFLLLWLLSSVPSKNLQGIADFFTPTLGLKDQAGIGFEGGNTPSTEGKKKGEWTNDAVVFGAPASGPVVKMPANATKMQEAIDAKNFSQLEHDLYKAVHDNPELSEFKDNILIEQTPDGLRIQLMDTDKRPMFFPGTSKLQPYAQKILAHIVELVRYLPNYIALSGHTTASRYAIAKDYDNWELSADRANAARRYMVSVKLDPEQITKIIGRADQEPLDPQRPEDVKNMRISMVLLKNAILPYQKQSAPDMKEKEGEKEQKNETKSSDEPAHKAQ